MKINIDRVLDVLLFSALYILGACALIFIGAFTNAKIPESDVVTCDNSSLQNIANCLHADLSSWWKYNISNSKLYWINQDINWSVIKEQGGVCWHSTKWYVAQAKEKGLKADEIILEGNEESHSLAMIWSKDLSEYCILDQNISPKCNHLDPWRFKNET